MFGGNLANDLEHRFETWNTGNPLESFIKGKTGSGLTDAQIQQNQWQENLANTEAQRRVADYQAAGLNTALMYQNGGTGASTPSGATVSGPTADFGSIVSAMTLPLQIEQMKANIQNTKERTGSEQARQELIRQQTANMRTQVNEILSRTDLNDAQRYQIVALSSWLDRREDANLRKVESEIKLNQSTRKRIDALLPAELDLQQMQLSDFIKAWEKIDAEISNLASQTKLNKRDLEDYAMNRLNTGIVADILRAYMEASHDKDNDGNRDE